MSDVVCKVKYELSNDFYHRRYVKLVTINSREHTDIQQIKTLNKKKTALSAVINQLQIFLEVYVFCVMTK